jgi:hypothetical protein
MPQKGPYGALVAPLRASIGARVSLGGSSAVSEQLVWNKVTSYGCSLSITLKDIPISMVAIGRPSLSAIAHDTRVLNMADYSAICRDTVIHISKDRLT